MSVTSWMLTTALLAAAACGPSPASVLEPTQSTPPSSSTSPATSAPRPAAIGEMRIAVRVDAYGQSEITVTGGVASSVVRCGTKLSGIENFAPVDVRLDQSGTGTCPLIKVYEGSTVIVRSSDGTLA